MHFNFAFIILSLKYKKKAKKSFNIKKYFPSENAENLHCFENKIELFIRWVQTATKWHFYIIISYLYI